MIFWGKIGEKQKQNCAKNFLGFLKITIFRDFFTVIWTVVLGVVKIRNKKRNHRDDLQPYVEQTGVWIWRLLCNHNEMKLVFYEKFL